MPTQTVDKPYTQSTPSLPPSLPPKPRPKRVRTKARKASSHDKEDSESEKKARKPRRPVHPWTDEQIESMFMFFKDLLEAQNDNQGFSESHVLDCALSLYAEYQVQVTAKQVRNKYDSFRPM